MPSTDMHRFTSGSITWSLIRFAIPFLCANFLISLYGAADVFIVSYFADSSALSATTTGFQAIFTVMALSIGLGMGGTVLIGQYFGAKREKDVIETIGTVLILFAGLSVICACCMIFMADTITHWMKTPEEAWVGTRNYIRICGGGMIFTFIYDAVSAILRGLGDSKNPLKFVAIAVVINVFLDLLFIGYFKWGASGAAAATIIAQSMSVIIGVIYLKKHNFIFDFQYKSFKFIPEKAKMILKLGIPMAIQQTIVFMSFTIMTIAVNKLGVIASAALGITNRIDGFLIMPALAFGSSISVVTAQNMGAGEIKRAQRSFYIGLLLSLIFAVPSFMMMLIWPERLMALASSDMKIIASGGDFMLAYSPDCILMALVFCINGFFNGCGRTTFTMVNNISSSIIFRIPLILVAKTLYGIGLSMPFSTLPQSLIAVAYFFTNRWKKPVIISQGNN